MNHRITIALCIFASLAAADIEIEGTALALASRSGQEDRHTIDLSTTAIPSGTVEAFFLDANAHVSVTLTSASNISTVHVVHTLDTGSVPVGSGATDGQFIFTVPQDTEFEFTGLLETITDIPSIGPVIRIRQQPSGTIRYIATPNFGHPNRPVDFSAILSQGTLNAGTYELSWFHAANYTSSTSPAIGNGDFTLTLTVPGCNAADFNADGVLNFFDVSAFLAAFSAMDLSADINNDGLLNFFDISSFLAEFATGCP